MPVTPTQDMIDKAVNETPETPSQDYWHDSQPISDDQAIACYKAMIGSVDQKSTFLELTDDIKKMLEDNGFKFKDMMDV